MTLTALPDAGALGEAAEQGAAAAVGTFEKYFGSFSWSKLISALILAAVCAVLIRLILAANDRMLKRSRLDGAVKPFLRTTLKLVLIFLAVIQVLILRAMLKVKIEEFYVLKFMGMQQHQLRQIVYRELLIYCLAAVIAVLIVTFGINMLGVGLLYESYQYMQLPGILLFVVYNLILMWMTASAFCRQVKKRI